MDYFDIIAIVMKAFSVIKSDIPLASRCIEFASCNIRCDGFAFGNYKD